MGGQMLSFPEKIAYTFINRYHFNTFQHMNILITSRYCVKFVFLVREVSLMGEGEAISNILCGV